MIVRHRKLPARFYSNPNGKEPVRDWLLSELNFEDRKRVAHDIRDCEFSWPIGMPLCRSMAGYPGLWEIRSSLKGGNIARIFFCVHENKMILLHAIKKKTQKTPEKDLKLALKRQKETQNG
jgi:phage-related protein